MVAAVGLRAACLLLVDLGASLGVKLGGRTIAKRSIACWRCPSLRVARSETVLPPLWPVMRPAGVRKGIVQRTVGAARGKRDYGRRKTVSYGPYDKAIIKGSPNVHSWP